MKICNIILLAMAVQAVKLDEDWLCRVAPTLPGACKGKLLAEVNTATATEWLHEGTFQLNSNNAPMR